MFEVDDAIQLATFAHRHQRDKIGEEYIGHCLRVFAHVQARAESDIDLQVAAILHDVVEDTPFTFEMLLALGVSEDSCELIRLVTRSEDVAKDDYYLGIHAAGPRAQLLKLGDIKDNTQEWRLAKLPPNTQDRLRKKYARASSIINNGELPIEGFY